MRAFLTLIISLWSLTSNRGAALMHADRWHQSCPSTNHRSISVELASVPLLWDQCWWVHSFPHFGWLLCSCQALAPLLVFLPSWWRWPSLLSSKPILLLQLCPWVLSIPLPSLSWLPHKLHHFVSLSGSLQATHHQATFDRPPLHRPR